MTKQARLFFALAFSLLAVPSLGQTAPYALLPPLQTCFSDSAGQPLVGGLVYSYSAGTSTQLATYSDSSGAFPNQNPVELDARGCAFIWLGPSAYKFILRDSGGSQIFTVDNVSDPGQLLYTQVVLLTPLGRALQTVQGPLGADYFQGITPHTTSPGVRVNLLDPSTALDTASNPPSLVTVQPASSGQNYYVPDPLSQNGNFVLSPGPGDWASSHAYVVGDVIHPKLGNPCRFDFTVSTAGSSGTSEPTFSTEPCGSSAATVSDSTVVWTSDGEVIPGNSLDCTKAGITCQRTAYVFFDGGSCNNGTAGMGWDTFGTNSPTPLCITGANVVKGTLAFPAAATVIQQNTATGSAATTVVVSYPAATSTGNFLVAEVAVDSSRTVSGCTDGTNAYTQAIHKANGALTLDIWFFDGNATGKAAATNLTCTFSGSGNSAINWREYSGVSITGGSIKDQTASNSATGTAVTSGTTAGTGQDVELVIAAVASPADSVVTSANGWTGHTLVHQATGPSLRSEGKIQQVSAAQSGTFTLDSSQSWASAIATFKVTVAGTVTAQRQWAIPPYYLASRPVNGTIKWLGSQPVAGTVAVDLGVSVVCTADGSTDDAAFNADTTSAPNVNQTAASAVTTTGFNSIDQTGCAAGQLMHYQLKRFRYDPQDTYEGWVQVLGASLSFGINQ